MLTLDPCVNLQDEVSRLVVRFKREHWRDKRGFHSKQTINILKRKTTDYALEDCFCEDANYTDIFDRIENIEKVEDGVYEVILTNMGMDWETGYIEAWDYKLVPLEV